MKSIKILIFLLVCAIVLVLWSLLWIYSPVCEILANRKIEKSFVVIGTRIEGGEIEGEENVFFIETSTTDFHEIDSRQACSIESAGNFCDNVQFVVDYQDLILISSHRLSKFSNLCHVSDKREFSVAEEFKIFKSFGELRQCKLSVHQYLDVF